MEKWIFVPKNKEGINNCRIMEFESEDVESYDIKDEEFDLLFSAGVFDAINEKCGLCIDDYEEEVISGKDIKKSIIITKKMDLPQNSSFIKALQAAEKYNTRAYLCFWLFAITA